MKKYFAFTSLVILSLFLSFKNNFITNPFKLIQDPIKGSFGYDLNFLQKHHKDLVVLSNENASAQIILSPSYQGRVMTSTAQGLNGLSFGWINYDLIEAGVYKPHIMAFGGEERLWLGPEGGQFSIFFKKGSTFNIENWQTPGVLDTASFDIIKKQKDKVVFSKNVELENYSGTKFKIKILREVSLLSQKQAESKLNIVLNNVSWVGYQSVNDLQNISKTDWDMSKGVLSIWVLGMMNASPANTIIIPFKKGQADKVNDLYFGKISKDKLLIKEDVLYFKGDAQSRGKIGIPPAALIPIAGSYDADKKILTILQFDYHGETEYVNSVWELQKFPYKGDVLNAYNDGKNDLGSQLGNFYELESSSPAVALKSKQTIRHVQRTYHFQGQEVDLDKICQKLLGVTLNEIPFKN